MPAQESSPTRLSLDDRLNPKLSGSSVVLLFVPEVAEEGVQPSLDDLGQGPGQGVVRDVEPFVHGVPGDAAQPAQQVQLVRQGLDGVVVSVQQLQGAEVAQGPRQAADVVILHDEDLQIGQILDTLGDVFQLVGPQVQEV